MKKITIMVDEDLFYQIKEDAIRKRLTLKAHMGTAIRYGFKAIKINDGKNKKKNIPSTPNSNSIDESLEIQ